MLIVDIGRAIYDFSVVYNCAREGARYGSVPGDYNNPPALRDGIVEAAESKAAGLNVTVDTPVRLGSTSPYQIKVRVYTTFSPVTLLVGELFGTNLTIESTAIMNIEK
jgi:hypothetical protein